MSLSQSTQNKEIEPGKGERIDSFQTDRSSSSQTTSTTHGLQFPVVLSGKCGYTHRRWCQFPLCQYLTSQPTALGQPFSSEEETLSSPTTQRKHMVAEETTYCGFNVIFRISNNVTQLLLTPVLFTWDEHRLAGGWHCLPSTNRNELTYLVSIHRCSSK